MAGSGAARSARVEEVVRWFGLNHARGQVEDVVTVPEVRAGEIVYVTGASGAGKSRLLRRMREQWSGAPHRDGTPGLTWGGENVACSASDVQRRTGGVRWVDLQRVRLPRTRVVVDCFPGRRLEDSLEILSRVGLAEAWDWVRTPADLSDGQRARLRIALGLWRAGQYNRGNPNELTVLACDEFCAILDRITARVVAHTLRRAIDRIPGTAAIVVTSHEDLGEALLPDVVVRCDFGRVEVCRRQAEGAEGDVRGVSPRTGGVP